MTQCGLPSDTRRTRAGLGECIPAIFAAGDTACNEKVQPRVCFGDENSLSFNGFPGAAAGSLAAGACVFGELPPSGDGEPGVD